MSDPLELRWIPLLLAPAAVGALLWAVGSGRKQAEWVLKPLCSLLFLGTAALQPRPDLRYATLVGVALLLGFAGDLALLSKERRGLAVGVGAFLLGHLSYTAAFAPRALESGAAWWPPLLVAAVLLTVLGLTLRAVWSGMGKLRYPVTVYGAALVTAAVSAVAAWLARRDAGSALAAAGLLLFLVSDVSIARHRFGGKGVEERLWGLPCYFGGQLLVAVSIGFAG